MKTWWRPSFSPPLPEAGRGLRLARRSGLVDAHVHVFPPEMMRRRETYLGKDARFDALYGSPKARMATAEEVLAQMDESGIELSIIFGFAFNDQGLCREVNDYVLEAVRAHPRRLAGLACVSAGAAGSPGRTGAVPGRRPARAAASWRRRPATQSEIADLAPDRRLSARARSAAAGPRQRTGGSRVPRQGPLHARGLRGPGPSLSRADHRVLAPGRRAVPV